ncbi:MAG: hypothetical protein DRN08_00990 [Thermoplasmata archaeon]|nr:MAG: hypothetical protein DRN05_01185 [Thermoplasmata archaeon]RLF36635.1 MAG: hypothetical protein DRN08_00990 [Thermoplasmata archaeon]
MWKKITAFLREYVSILSIITIVLGLLLFFMGIIWYWFRDVQIGLYTNIINRLEDWNAYLLVLGFIMLIMGTWYLYSYSKKRKFVLNELKTNKRSELLKRHNELEYTVKHLPSKYKKMLEEKKEELGIK